MRVVYCQCIYIVMDAGGGNGIFNFAHQILNGIYQYPISMRNSWEAMVSPVVRN